MPGMCAIFSFLTWGCRGSLAASFAFLTGRVSRPRLGHKTPPSPIEKRFAHQPTLSLATRIPFPCLQYLLSCIVRRPLLPALSLPQYIISNMRIPSHAACWIIAPPRSAAWDHPSVRKAMIHKDMSLSLSLGTTVTRVTVTVAYVTHLRGRRIYVAPGARSPCSAMAVV